MWEEYAPSLSSLSVLLLHQSGSAGSKAVIIMSPALGTSLVEVFKTTLALVPDAKSEFVSTALLMEVQVFLYSPQITFGNLARSYVL